VPESALVVGYNYKLKKEQQKNRCINCQRFLQSLYFYANSLMQKNKSYRDFHQNPNLKTFLMSYCQHTPFYYSLLRYRHIVKVFLFFYLFFCCPPTFFFIYTANQAFCSKITIKIDIQLYSLDIFVNPF